MKPDVRFVGVTAPVYLVRYLAHMEESIPVWPFPEEISYPVILAVDGDAFTIDGHFLQGCTDCGTEGGLDRPLSVVIPLKGQSGPLLGLTTHLWRERALRLNAFIPDQLRHLRYLLHCRLSVF